MASYRTHEIFNVAILVPALIFLPEDAKVPFGVGYLIGTFFLSPDIDLHYSKPSQRWKLLRYIWLPFWIFSKHRGITHVPVLGSLIKFFYLSFLIVFAYFSLLGIFAILNYKPEFLLNFNIFDFLENFLKSREGLFFILGVITSDLMHILLDNLKIKF